MTLYYRIFIVPKKNMKLIIGKEIYHYMGLEVCVSNAILLQYGYRKYSQSIVTENTVASQILEKKEGNENTYLGYTSNILD